MVAAGHYLAAAAGYRILEDGGNAIDAGVASGIAINVTLPNDTSFGGVAPIVIYDVATDSVVTISGLGRWPRATSIDYFLRELGGQIPLGVHRTVVPAAADAWLTALEKYGTMTFEQVVTPALDLAENGFPLSAYLRNYLSNAAETKDGSLSTWDSTRDVFMPNGRMPLVGEPLVQNDLARTFRRLIEVEKSNLHLGREAAIRTARDYFYKGEIAEEMARFSQERGGLLTLEDLKDFSVRVEEPEVGQFRDYSVYTCGPWCQGPVVAQTLQMLAKDDLAALGHNSSDYIHLLSQTLNLVFSDREHFYGDPDFIDVPIEGLLSPEYTNERRRAVDMVRAFSEMPPPGEPSIHVPNSATGVTNRSYTRLRGVQPRDTSYTCVVDKWGNAFSATPSDVLSGGPIVPSLGFVLSNRGSQSWLDPDHPSSVHPWKRPRLTPNPAIAFKGGKLFMPFGTPGGDAQCSAMVQMFLNIVEFGMDPQQAVERPRFIPLNFPNSFWPHTYLPGRLNIEGRISHETTSELSRRGHDIQIIDDWTPAAGSPCGILVDQDSGVLKAGADPRRDAYAVGR